MGGGGGGESESGVTALHAGTLAQWFERLLLLLWSSMGFYLV